MKTTLSSLITFLIIVCLWSCDKHQKREAKYADGKPKEAFQVLEQNGNFIKDGDYKTWYQSGQQETSGEYSNGLKVANWKQWYDNGRWQQMGFTRMTHLTEALPSGSKTETPVCAKIMTTMERKMDYASIGLTIGKRRKK